MVTSDNRKQRQGSPGEEKSYYSPCLWPGEHFPGCSAGKRNSNRSRVLSELERPSWEFLKSKKSQQYSGETAAKKESSRSLTGMTDGAGVWTNYLWPKKGLPERSIMLYLQSTIGQEESVFPPARVQRPPDPLDTCRILGMALTWQP